MPSAMRSTGWTVALILPALIIAPLAAGADPSASQDTNAPAPTVVMTAQQDHQRIMNLLHISSLRPGANGNNRQAPNAANYDESKANPYRNIPDGLILKDGRKVTKATAWWNQRRAEILEDFDREIYGRVPKVAPKVKWEVASTTREVKFEVPVITKQLVGHVDNTSYPLIAVDIQLTLTTPASAAGPVPVIMEFGFSGSRAAGGAPPTAGAASWQQQVLARGWVASGKKGYGDSGVSSG